MLAAASLSAHLVRPWSAAVSLKGEEISCMVCAAAVRSEEAPQVRLSWPGLPQQHRRSAFPKGENCLSRLWFGVARNRPISPVSLLPRVSPQAFRTPLLNPYSRHTRSRSTCWPVVTRDVRVLRRGTWLHISLKGRHPYQ